MATHEPFYDMIFDNLRKFAFPEEWLLLDKALAKQDLMSLLMIDRLGECTMSQLAEHMSFPLSTTTGIVDRLVKKGYVHRFRSETDRRMVLIDLTEQGQGFAKETKQKLMQLIERLFEVLSDEEKALIFSLLDKVSKVFRELGQDSEDTESSKPMVQKITIE